jgi:hypothetical protein
VFLFFAFHSCSTLSLSSFLPYFLFLFISFLLSTNYAQAVRASFFQLVVSILVVHVFKVYFSEPSIVIIRRNGLMLSCRCVWPLIVIYEPNN